MVGFVINKEIEMKLGKEIAGVNFKNSLFWIEYRRVGTCIQAAI